MPASNGNAASGRSAAAKRRLFQPKDLITRVLVADAALSPDGETIVFGRQTVVNGEERSRLWRVPVRGGRPEPLTDADTNSTVPRFSRDGRWLGFLSDRGTREAEKVSQPWRLPIGGGEAEPFPTLPDGADSLEWAPNGDAILCTGSSGVHRFAVGDPKDPTARTITAPHWLSDGQGIRDPLTSAWVVPMKGEPKRVTDPAHMVSGAFWSPNGERRGVPRRSVRSATGAGPQASVVGVPIGRRRP